MLKTVVAAAVVVSFVLAVGAMPSETRATDASVKVSGRVLRDTAGGGTASIVVYLRDQADLRRAYAMSDQNARGWYVYRTLKAHAARTQAPLRAWLRKQHAPYRAFWAANMIVSRGNRTLVNKLAARRDVRLIESGRSSKGLQVEPLPLRTALDALEARPAAQARTAGIEWGVNDVHAPSLWSLGFTGQGMVVASADTGVRWTHSAIKSHYRGWNGSAADHNYNWHDAIHTGGGSCGANAVQPCDDSAHGTHTTGTVVGDDGAGNQIGVAPGAKWIGCRNMDQGTGSPATYTECFQWFIAPTDLGGRQCRPDEASRCRHGQLDMPAERGVRGQHAEDDRR